MNNHTNYCADFLSSPNAHKVRNPVLRRLRQAVKFRLPDGGVVIDYAKINDANSTGTANFEVSADYISHLKLPYDNIALEVPMGQNSKAIIVAAHAEDGSDAILFAGLSMNFSGEINNKWLEFGATGIIFPDFTVGFNVDKAFDISGDEDGEEKAGDLMASLGYVILSFMAALQCSNVSEEDQLAAIKLNKSRVKKGKEPFFDYKILTIDTKESTNGSKSGVNSEPQNSKRAHLRRGHIRRLEHKTVWVNPCIVGDKTKGFASKDYNVV